MKSQLISPICLSMRRRLFSRGHQVGWRCRSVAAMYPPSPSYVSFFIIQPRSCDLPGLTIYLPSTIVDLHRPTSCKNNRRPFWGPHNCMIYLVSTSFHPWFCLRMAIIGMFFQDGLTGWGLTTNPTQQKTTQDQQSATHLNYVCMKGCKSISIYIYVC